MNNGAAIIIDSKLLTEKPKRITDIQKCEVTVQTISDDNAYKPTYEYTKFVVDFKHRKDGSLRSWYVYH